MSRQVIANGAQKNNLNSCSAPEPEPARFQRDNCPAYFFAGPNATTGRMLRYGLGATIGILIALILVASRCVVIDPTLSAGNILQASTTVLTGLVIAVIVQKMLRKDEREKDFLVKQLEALSALIADLQGPEDGRELTQVIAVLKKIRTLTTAIYQVVVTLNRRALSVDLFDFADDIKELRSLATDTPTREIKESMVKSRVKAEVKEGIIKLAQDREAELEAKLQHLSRRILQAQVSVIKA